MQDDRIGNGFYILIIIWLSFFQIQLIFFSDDSPVNSLFILKYLYNVYVVLRSTDVKQASNFVCVLSYLSKVLDNHFVFFM
jgi:hypothetical protein